MHQFDFNILEPAEFEILAADIFAARENTANNTSYVPIMQPEGPDGGIDFKLNDGQIIGQVKRYTDKNSLLASLRKEVQKVIIIAPERYILVVSLTLSYGFRNQIQQLFHPYIKSASDIMDATDLNRLLHLHKEVLLRHYKLWMSATGVLQKLIEDAVTVALHNQTRKNAIAELKEITALKDYYVPNKFFAEGIQVLKNNNVLLITGNAGIGKTTLARALCRYFLEYEHYGEFYYHYGINLNLQMPDTAVKSVFFIDDFLGTVIYDQARIENIGYFQKFVDKIIDEGHLLILTTREYIYQQEKKANVRFRQMEDYKYIVQLKWYSRLEKFNILFNQLKRAALFHHIMHELQYVWESIVNHPNYLPKLITEFIRKDGKKYLRTTQWFTALKSYLDDPYDYWETIFLELTEGAQQFLLCFFISDDRCHHSFLLDTFKRVNCYREVVKPNREAALFNQIVEELKDVFIYIDKDTITNEPAYSFSSTFVKDFLLAYLRKNDHLIEFLIKGAIAFNQLTHAFTTLEDDFILAKDYILDLQGRRILLNEHLQAVFLAKVINEFDNLPEMPLGRFAWDDESVTFEKLKPEDNRVYRFRTFMMLFGRNNAPEKKAFMIRKLGEFCLWELLDVELNIVEFDALPELFRTIKLYFEVDPFAVMLLYYLKIERLSSFASFHDFSMPFPKEFDLFLAHNRKEMFKELQKIVILEIAILINKPGKFLYDGLQDLFSEIEMIAYHYNFKISKNDRNFWESLVAQGKQPKDSTTSQDRNVFDLSDFENEWYFSVEEPSAIEDRIRDFLPKNVDHATDHALISPYNEHPEIILNPVNAKLTCVFDAKQRAIIAGFGAFLLCNPSFFFKECHFSDYYNQSQYDPSAFDKLYRSGLISKNNGWCYFVQIEIVYALAAIDLINSPDKKAIYRNHHHSNFEEKFIFLLPYLYYLDRIDFEANYQNASKV